MSGIQLPAKLLTATITSFTGIEQWPFDDGEGDPWWSGGASPRFYRWEVNVSVTPQQHSNHLTRVPFLFNAFDIKVGDWIANNSSGQTLLITGVTSKTANSATLQVEDVNRYNTFRDPSGGGNGFIGTGNSLIFGLNEEGKPLLDTITQGLVAEIFTNNLMGRFQNINAEYDFALNQPGHSFKIGDLIAADDANNEWVSTNTQNIIVVGRVSALGPGPDNFYITPIQKVITGLDALPGNKADILYVDESQPQDVTLTPNSQPIYVKLRDQTSTQIASSIAPISTGAGSVLSINGTDITFSTGDSADVIASINNETATTGVTASGLIAPSLAVPDPSNLGYGVTGAIGDTQAGTINGIPFVFDITTNGTVAFGITAANQDDMAAAITRDVTSVDSNIIAVAQGSLLNISNLTGGSITITTTVTDGSGFPVAGSGSSTGLPVSTPANTDSSLMLTKNDAGVIELADIVGTPQEDLGVFTVENGAKAAALYIQGGLSQASVTVVSDISVRNALSPNVGDQAHVLDKGNGEWELYLWDGSAWVAIANEDSARTDADSAQYMLNFNSPSVSEIVTVSTGSRVTLITVEVITPFDGNPTMGVGYGSDFDALFQDDFVDLSTVGSYANQTDMFFNTGQDTDIVVQYTANGATQGQSRIVVTYV